MKKKNAKRQTVVVSAFPACGDCKIYKDIWDIRDERENKTPVKAVKSAIGTADFIFVSHDETVRKSLKDAKIPYLCVYPGSECKAGWLRRTEGETRNQLENDWESLIASMRNEDGPRLMLTTDNLWLDAQILLAIQRLWPAWPRAKK